MDHATVEDRKEIPGILAQSFSNWIKMQEVQRRSVVPEKNLK